MTTFDLHQHFWPEGFVAELRARSTPPCLDAQNTLAIHEGRFPVDLLDLDVGNRIARLDRDGIDVAVMSLQPTIGVDALPDSERRALEDTWIEGMREVVSRSDGRFRAFAPARAVDGCAGTTVSALELAELDRVAPLLDEVERSGGLLFVHPGPVPRRDDEPPWWAGTVAYTAQMQSAWFSWLGGGRERWPKLPIVFAILAGGAPFHLERLARRGIDVRSTLDENVYLDVATYGRRAIELCIETFGVEQLLYGSDEPVVDPAPTLRAIRGFGDSVARIVYSDNPTRLIE